MKLLFSTTVLSALLLSTVSFAQATAPIRIDHIVNSSGESILDPDVNANIGTPQQVWLCDVFVANVYKHTLLTLGTVGGANPETNYVVFSNGVLNSSASVKCKIRGTVQP